MSGIVGSILSGSSGGGGGGDASAANQSLEIAAINKINAQILDLNSGAGTANTVGLFIALPSGSGPVAGGTSVNPVFTTSGLGVIGYDYVALTQASTTDTYVFKVGGSGGSTIATLTITYTDSTKAILDNVAKS